MQWSVPRMWEGETCYILGGGPSLKGVNLEGLRGRKVIAVNNAYRLAPWADILYFMDCVWHEWHGEEIKGFKGLVVTICTDVKDDPNIKVLKRGMNHLLSEEPETLPRGTHAGDGAMCLAEMLGVKKIVLVGFDMRVVEGEHNWHKDHKREVPENIYDSQYKNSMTLLGGAIMAKGVDIVNATPDSALHLFPLVDLEEVLS